VKNPSYHRTYQSTYLPTNNYGRWVGMEVNSEKWRVKNLS